jgi:hypothetical protein
MSTTVSRPVDGPGTSVTPNPSGTAAPNAIAVPTPSVLSPRPNWGAIWAGVFTFMAIWSVFGLLGMAIFSSPANPAKAVSGMSVGMGIWGIILTIIAMYVGGLATGRLAGINNRRDGIVHGMIMFGLSVMAILIVVALGAGSAANAQTAATTVGASSSYVLTAFADLGWIGFVALLLGWLAAMGGAFQGVQRRMNEITSR